MLFYLYNDLQGYVKAIEDYKLFDVIASILYCPFFWLLLQIFSLRFLLAILLLFFYHVWLLEFICIGDNLLVFNERL